MGIIRHTGWRMALAIAFAASASGLAHAEVVELGGARVQVTDALPAELVGRYLYEREGEPIVEINADGTGAFQPHMEQAIPLRRIWLLADDSGTAVKEEGAGGYRYTVVVQYGESHNGNYPSNGYDSFYWMRSHESGCAIVLGERYKC